MIAEIVVSLFVVWLTWSVVTTYMMRKGMPPGPFPLPLIGNFLYILCDPADTFNKLAEKYGDIYTLSFPTGNTVVLNTALVVRQARLKERGDLVWKSSESMYPFNVMLGNDFVSLDYSPKYVFRKKIFLSTLHRIESEVNNESSTELAVDAIKILLEEIESNEGKPFSAKKRLHASILAQLWKMLTGKKVSTDEPLVNSLVEFGEILGRQALKATFYQLFPFPSCLSGQFSRDIKRAVEIRETTLPQEFKAHPETYQPNVIHDLTDGFISAFKEEIPKQDGSLGVVPELMIDFVFAGSESTSSSLAWFLLYMVLHKNVQEKIHLEIDKVVATDRNPKWDDIKDMPYLQATLCEVLRMVTVGPLSRAYAMWNVGIAGHNVPEGSLVAFNLSQVHHDEREWPEPDVFKPERFLDSEGSFVGWTKLHGFMPFGLGRGECAGQSLARIMMLTFASTLLHRYEIVLPDGAVMPSTKFPAFGTVLHLEEFEILTKKRF